MIERLRISCQLVVYLIVYIVAAQTKQMTRRNAPAIADNCRAFNDGDATRKMFFSPNYPGDYPNKTDCVRVIKAPPNHLIKLDFRDYFHIEPSPACKFDHLEVRDGAYGYSNVIGQYCGGEFPPLIVTTGPYLYVRFTSDDNIEMRGFIAVYEFVPRPETAPPEMEACFFDLNGLNTGVINSSYVPSGQLTMTQTYNLALDCLWKITVDASFKISIVFLTFRLALPNDCDNNYVDVFLDHTDMASLDKRYCGSIADAVYSKNNVVYVRYFAESRATTSAFEIVFTAFRERSMNTSCHADEYDCQDNTCIHSSLVCNAQPNCRYKWDELECGSRTNKRLPENIIIMIVVFCLIVSGMFAAFVVNCVNKLRHDHRLIQEHIRKSRESRLDQTERKGATKLKSNVSLIPGTIIPGTPPLLSIPHIHRSRSRSNSTQSYRTQENHYVLNSMELAVGSKTDADLYSDTHEIAVQTRESLFDDVAPYPATNCQFSTFTRHESQQYAGQSFANIVKGGAGNKLVLKQRPDVIVTH